jgi:hypothetical protein
MLGLAESISEVVGPTKPRRDIPKGSFKGKSRRGLFVWSSDAKPAEIYLTPQDIVSWIQATFGHEVHVRTVQTWCQSSSKPLPHVRLGNRILVRPRDLQTWLQAGGVAAGVAKGSGQPEDKWNSKEL